MSLLKPGTNLARYTILGKLATGGMSEVYLARQSGPSGFSKILVLKVILPHLCEDPEFVSMFHNEAKLAALLNHPNVVQIFDFSVEEEGTFMAMEYIDGQDLGRIIDKLEQDGGTLPVPEALRVISDACGALEYAHSFTDPGGTHLEIIHRDISLDNILVTYSGQVKLVDFGIAKARNLESHTAVGTLRGKFNYMAPELLKGDKLDNRVDIFSMGVVLYRALVGEMPYQGDNHAQLINAIVHRDPPRPREVNPDLPEELEQIMMGALAKDRDQRYQRAGEIQIDLEAYMLGQGRAVMPYHLAQFMGSVFPPGTDSARERYRKLAGITTSTPGKADSKPTKKVAAAGERPTIKAEPSMLFKSTLVGDDSEQQGSADGGGGFGPAAGQRGRAPGATAKMMEASTMIATEDELDELVLDEVDLLEDISELDGVPVEGTDLRDAARSLSGPTSVFSRTPGRARVQPTEETALDVEVEGVLADLDTAELDGALSDLHTNEINTTAQGLLKDDTPVDGQLPSFGPLKEVSTSDDPTRIQEVPVFDMAPGDAAPGDEQTVERQIPPAPGSTTGETPAITEPPSCTGEMPSATGEMPSATPPTTPPPKKRGGSMMMMALGLLVLGGGGAGVYYFAVHQRTTPVSLVDGGSVPVGKPADGATARSDGAAGDSAAGDSAAAEADAATAGADAAPVEADSVPPAKPDSTPPAKPDMRSVHRTKPDMRAARRAKPDMRAARRVPPPRARTLLSVTSPGPGDVMMGRRRLGGLPLRSVAVKPGNLRLLVRSRELGYWIYRNITIKAGTHRQLKITPRMGTLRVLVRPWARVTLDGKLLGTTPLAPRKVYEGFHTLELSNDDPKAKKKTRIKVDPGKETLIKVRMNQ